MIFRRADVKHRKFYCRAKVPQTDRYKIIALESGGSRSRAAGGFPLRPCRADQAAKRRAAFLPPVSDIAADYLAVQKERFETGSITKKRLGRSKAPSTRSISRSARSKAARPRAAGNGRVIQGQGSAKQGCALFMTTCRIVASRVADEGLVFETLKQRKRGLFRAVPVPRPLITLLITYARHRVDRLWPWGRTKAWKIVKSVMREAGTADCLCKPNALRHAFAMEAGQRAIPPNIVQRWLGHARIETAAIYAGAIGDEERNLARRAWSTLELTLPGRLH